MDLIFLLFLRILSLGTKVLGTYGFNLPIISKNIKSWDEGTHYSPSEHVFNLPIRIHSTTYGFNLPIISKNIKSWDEGTHYSPSEHVYGFNLPIRIHSTTYGFNLPIISKNIKSNF